MQVKGKAIFEFVDVNTGEKRVEERDNFIFLDKYIDLFQGETVIQRLAILYRGSETYPMVNRYSPYYGNLENSAFYTGYAPTGTALKKYFPKTTESPAYWEYYSLFPPPASTAAISCICLISYNIGDNQLPYVGYTSWIYSSHAKTAINLSPPCYQSPTEYLNVYYRLILVEDETDTTNNDWVKEQFLLDVDRNPKRFYQNDNIQLYPFRIEQDLGANGYVNFLSGGYASLGSKETVHPNGLNLSLYSARKIYNYPDNIPNQYNQIQDTFLNTVIRAGRTRISYMVSLLHPDKFTPEIGGPEGFTGIGNVFGTASSSNSNYFDPAFFPLGSGRMYASGQWNGAEIKQPFPSKFVAYITQTGELASDMKYNVREYHRSPDAILNLLPYAYRDSSQYWTNGAQYTYDNILKNIMYSRPDHVHVQYYAGVRKWIEDRAFITYDKTGITIYDIYYGKIESWDATTTPSLAVTNIQDVKVDTYGNIWVACASTGLWKLTITETETTLVHIGAPPGCQSKVYALDVDNFGNVYAIFWGLGLHYTTDGGQTWVNVIINYPSFSNFDEGGTNSKWRFCSRLIVNPHRDVRNGDAQILLLQRTDVNDGSTTAGCWYDQISANVTGITNSTLRNQLAFVRNSNRHQSMIVSRLENKWMFLNDWSSGSGSYYTYTSRSPGISGTTQYAINVDTVLYIPFQHNAGATRVNMRLKPGSNSGYNRIWYRHIEYAYEWDSDFGEYREFAYIPGIKSTGPAVIDIAHNESRTAMLDWVENADRSTNSDIYATNCCFIGKNRVLGFLATDLFYNHYYLYWCVHEFIGSSKQWKTFNSTLWGWDGGNWVKNHPGSKTGHTTTEPFIKGISLRFENGPASTTSFVATDQYTFTCFDGYYKDNSSKMWIRDTVYYKPKEVVTTFTPPTVQLYDRSHQIGILNSPDINVDWNIDALPDTTYDGQPIVLDGDVYYPYVVYLNYFEKAGDYGMKDEKWNQPPTAIEGELAPSSDVPIVWSGTGESKPTTYFDGESGIFYASQTRYSMGSGNFTLELWIYPTNYNVTEQILVDFRGAANEIGALSLNTQGQLAWWNGSTTFGQTGPSVIPDSWNFVTLVRKANNNWEMTLNGTSVATWTDSTGFPSTRPLHIGKRFARTTTWTLQNGSIPVTKYPNPSGVMSAEAFIPNTTNIDVHNFYQYKTLQQGTYTSSIFAKKGTRRYFMLRTGINNTDTRSVYDFDTDTFVTVGSGHTVGREVLTNGWVRLWVTATENSNNVSRYFAWGPTGSTNPTTSWAGNGTEEACYVWGAMLNSGTTPGTYTPSGSLENMWLQDSENFGGNWRGFRGYMSNLRITKGIDRYNGNISPLPNKPFQNSGNDYSGARLKFPGNYLQGGIVARKELVGDWVVVFRDIPSWFRMRDYGRPSLVFGITSAPVINNLTDIGYRFLAGANDTLLFQRWMDVWSNGNLGSNINAVRFRKVGTNIFIDTSTTNGIFWSNNQFSYTDHAGIHYIAMWQERPSSDKINRPLISPSVEIVQNGSDYISRVGSVAFANGSFHPKFLAVDSYWGSDFKIQLNGVPTTKNRSNYQAEALPLQGEVYLHQHGTLRFHPADVGKTITGTVIALHD